MLAGEVTASPRPSPDRALALRLGFVCFLFFLVFNHGHYKGSDEVGFLQVTRALAERGDIAVPRMQHTDPGIDGRYYSHFSIGQSVAALPLYALGRLAEAVLPKSAVRALAGPDQKDVNQRFSGKVVIFTTGLHAPIAAALLVVLFFAFECALGISRRVAVACALLLAGTTYVALMSTYFLRHSSEAITLIGALYFFYRWRLGGTRRDLLFGSMLASATLIVRLPAGVGGLAIGGYLLWCIYERGGRRWNPALLRSVVAPVAIPLLLVMAVSAAIDWSRWGVPWNVPQFRTGSLHTTPLYVSVWAALLSPGMGVFVYSPPLLLALWTFPVLWRRRRPEAVAFLVLAASFLFAFSSFSGWTGLWSSPGPRYQFISVPLFMLPLGMWLDERYSRGRVAAVGVFAALGAWVQLVMMTTHWGALIEFMKYRNALPKWAFLYPPDHSPIVGASRLFLDGMYRDNWLLSLARGWPGQDPHPGAALLIFGLWAVLFGWAITALVRCLRRTPN